MALYRVQNSAMPTTAPATPVTTSATLYTSLQIVGPSSGAQSPIKIVEWGVSFNGSVLAAGFECELVDTGTVAATVTAYAAADVMSYDADAIATPQSGTTSGYPLILSTSASGYTSSAEGSTTTCYVKDSAMVEPIGGYFKQFPEGREPWLKPGDVMRIRIKGDGTTTHYSYLVFQS